MVIVGAAKDCQRVSATTLVVIRCGAPKRASIVSVSVAEDLSAEKFLVAALGVEYEWF